MMYDSCNGLESYDVEWHIPTIGLVCVTTGLGRHPTKKMWPLSLLHNYLGNRNKEINVLALLALIRDGRNPLALL